MTAQSGGLHRIRTDTITPEVTKEPSEYCPNCSEKLIGHSCKLVCPRCGYFLSCSDYY